MNSKDWFVVGVRLFGVWLLLSALAEAVAFVEVQSNMVSPRQTTAGAYVFHGVVDFLGACLLLWGAQPLAGLFDWRQHGPAPTEQGFPIEPNE